MVGAYRDTSKTEPCSRVRPMPCRCPIPNTIGRSYADTDTDTNTGLYNFFVLKVLFCVGIGVCRLYMYAGYMRKIRYRLETICMHCNSVDC